MTTPKVQGIKKSPKITKMQRLEGRVVRLELIVMSLNKALQDHQNLLNAIIASATREDGTPLVQPDEDESAQPVDLRTVGNPEDLKVSDAPEVME